MQNSELYRRGFVVPLDHEALGAMLGNCVDGGVNVSFFEISNEIVFEGVWRSGFFAEINKQLGLMIDDYEEEWIEYEKLQDALKVVHKFKNEFCGNLEEVKVINGLERAITTAIKHKTSVAIIL